MIQSSLSPKFNLFSLHYCTYLYPARTILNVLGYSRLLGRMDLAQGELSGMRKDFGNFRVIYSRLDAFLLIILGSIFFTL